MARRLRHPALALTIFLAALSTASYLIPIEVGNPRSSTRWVDLSLTRARLSLILAATAPLQAQSSRESRRAQAQWELDLIQTEIRQYQYRHEPGLHGQLPSLTHARSPGGTILTLYLPLLPPLVLSTTAAAWFWFRPRYRKPGHCTACGYSLEGLATPHCPECERLVAPVPPGTRLPALRSSTPPPA